jgi:acyl dehydratase
MEAESHCVRPCSMVWDIHGWIAAGPCFPCYDAVMGEVRFDDLEALKALVSEDFSDFGPSIEIDQAMIDRFAEVTHDQQWIHTDAERCARESPLGTTIAHGHLLLSLLGALREGNGAKLTGHKSVINYGADKLRFTAPVPVGSKIHARGRIAHVRKKGLGAQLTFESEIWVVGGAKPAVSYRSLVLFMP